MAEDMEFLPRAQVLSIEELALVAEAFTRLGVNTIRLTGGEPLVRRGLVTLCKKISALPNLRSLAMTTNGARLGLMGAELRRAGVNRINISLDSLREDRFKALTRFGALDKVLAGIDVAREAGFDGIKINSVVLRHHNLDEVKDLARFALERNLDISFIEEMPLGHIQSHQREQEFVSSEELRKVLSEEWALSPSAHESGGPSRYWQAAGFDARIGFISPHSQNFCDSCNRVRVTAEGRLLLCLGNEHSVDLRRVLRAPNIPHPVEALMEAIVDAMHIKPERHTFSERDAPQIVRFMNATGG